VLDGTTKDVLMPIVSRYSSQEDIEVITKNLEVIEKLKKELSVVGITQDKRSEINDVRVDSLKNLNKKISNTFSNAFIGISSKLQSPNVVDFNKQLGKKTSGFISSIPGLNVTNFADGLSQFLIERANEELNVLFFDRFRDALIASEELKTLFPKTSQFLIGTQAYEYARNLNLLKETFKTDLTNLIGNMEALATLKKYQELAKENPKFGAVLVGLSASAIVSQMENGAHPADVIDELGSKEYLAGVKTDMYNVLRLISLTSKSIRYKDDSQPYVSFDDIKSNLINDPVTFQIYMGLIYQRCAGIVIGGKSVQDELMSKKGQILTAKNFGLELFDQLNKMNTGFESLKQKKKDGELTYEDKYAFYGRVLDLIEYSFKIDEVFKIEADIKKGQFDPEEYIHVARLGNELYKNVNEKSYSMAVVNFSLAYDATLGLWKGQKSVDELPKGKKAQKIELIEARVDSDDKVNINNKSVTVKSQLKKYYGVKSFRKAKGIFEDSVKVASFKSNFLKYAAFMASIAEAQSADDAKAAIKAAALPAGSASIKKSVKFNVSVNAYLGGSVGISNQVESGSNSEDFSSLGLWAPVGLAVSTNWGNKKGGSWSLYGSLIDVGAFASFRLKNGNDAVLPEVELKNIIAPGIHLIYGLPKAPFSISAGYQWGPSLREFTFDENGTSQTVEGSVRGVRIGLSFDIPLFNLFTSAN
jgi:hypothetical protein